MPESIVLLHGFAGTHRVWDGVIAHLDGERFAVRAPDLPGHGEAGIRPPITFESCVAAVLDGAPPRFVLCGYSMGGRIALHVALAAPERVRRLVLVSSSPGIEDTDARLQRRAQDTALAEELESGPFESFIERWRSQPLFAGEPARAGELARADHRRNSPRALAAALRGIGAGRMRPLWERLGELAMPVSVIAGARDGRYVAIGERVAALVPDGELLVVAGGHGLPLENPAAIAHALEGDDPEAGGGR